MKRYNVCVDVSHYGRAWVSVEAPDDATEEEIGEIAEGWCWEGMDDEWTQDGIEYGVSSMSAVSPGDRLNKNLIISAYNNDGELENVEVVQTQPLPDQQVLEFAKE